MAIEPQGLENSRTKGLILAEESVQERDERLRDRKENVWPRAQEGDYGPPKSMVAIEYSIAANSSSQAVLQADLVDGASISQPGSVAANRENIHNRKVVNMPPLPLDAC